MTVPIGSALGDYPYILVRIACYDCERHGCYRLTGLVAKYGCNITMFELLDKLVTDCWRWHWKVHYPGDPCGAHFLDLPPDDLSDAPPTAPISGW